MIVGTAHLSKRVLGAYRGVTEVVVSVQCHNEGILPITSSPPYPDSAFTGVTCTRGWVWRYIPPPLPPAIYSSLIPYAEGLMQSSAFTPLHVEIGLMTPAIRKLYSDGGIREYLLELPDPDYPITYSSPTCQSTTRHRTFGSPHMFCERLYDLVSPIRRAEASVVRPSASSCVNA
jgi:hypothetical protein